MKILITIGHPAHIHYFKHTVGALKKKGYDFLFFVRDRECIIDLVKELDYKYVSYGKGGDSMLSKMVHIPIIDYKLLKVAIKYKPDIFLSFASGYAGHVATILRKPHITLDDTEHAKLSHKLCYPFSNIIFSPYVWASELHKRQVLLQSLIEAIYLHENYFEPTPEIKSLLNVSENEKYCVIRIVSSNANHDVGLDVLTLDAKIKFIKSLAQKYKVFISSEIPLPPDMEKHRLITHPSLFHSVIYYSSLCISDGATTASEAAVLGIPTICTAPLSLKLNNCDLEVKCGLLYRLTDVNSIINKAIEILETEDLKDIYRSRKNTLLSGMIDINKFLVWFIENYPESKKIMKGNPDYQYKFK